MRKRLSIKARITLWYALLLLALCAAAALVLTQLAGYAAQRYYSDTLQSAKAVILDELEVEHGVLEIDSDIDEIPGVYASLFDARGGLIYGRRRGSAPFDEDGVRAVQEGGHRWMILDSRIALPGREDVWLRLYVSADLFGGVYGALLRGGVWLLPLLALVALVGGYLLTARAFRPVQEMTRLAASIAGGQDLTRRVASRGDGDELDGLCGTINAMLERLQRAFEHERQFTSDAAHELRTPLNAMRIQGEYALSRADADEKDEAIARMLEKNGEMQALVGQLLMLARLDAGQLLPDGEIDLAQLAEAVAREMEPVAQEKGVALETALAPCRVTGNRAMLTRAAVNLIDNAIRYTGPGGCVRVSAAQEGDGAVLCVADTGCGIAPQDLPHVFERFWRADGARAAQGTGIGLAIVQSVAQAHGGSVQVQSEPGQGSCFTLRLGGRAVPAPASERESRAADLCGRGRKS